MSSTTYCITVYYTKYSILSFTTKHIKCRQNYSIVKNH